MSARYEFGSAGDTPAFVVRPGSEDAGRMELEDGEYALVIGDPWASAYAVTGTPDELRTFAAQLSRTLRNLPN